MKGKKDQGTKTKISRVVIVQTVAELFSENENEANISVRGDN